MSDLISIVAQAWAWTGLRPHSILEINAFGNVIALALDGRYWRICPENLSCQIIAADADSYAGLRATAEFEIDWNMEQLRTAAHKAVGPVPLGSCYCLKIPAVLGGEYLPSNIGTIRISELLAASGHLALQIKDLPDGAQVRLDIVD